MSAESSTKTGLLPEWEELSSGVLILRLGHPSGPVLLSPELFDELEKCGTELRQRRPRGLLLCGPRPDFFGAGIDLDRVAGFTRPQLENFLRQGRRLCRDLATLPCPTAAIIGGPCVGGACELALACDYRLISDNPSSAMGLPEVKLGIVPGFGGTACMRNLLGLKTTLEIILGGRILDPADARRCGLVDGILPALELLKSAEHFLLEHASKAKRRLTLHRWWNSFYPPQRILIKQARRRSGQNGGEHYPALNAAIDCIVGCRNQNAAEQEVKTVLDLAETAQCRALLHLAQATRTVNRIGKSARARLRQEAIIIQGVNAAAQRLAALVLPTDLSLLWQDPDLPLLERALRRILRAKQPAESLAGYPRVQLSTQPPIGTQQKKMILDCRVAAADGLAAAVETAAGKDIAEDLTLTVVAAALRVPRESLSGSNTTLLFNLWPSAATAVLVELLPAAATPPAALVRAAALAARIKLTPIVLCSAAGSLMARLVGVYLCEGLKIAAEGMPFSAMTTAVRAAGWQRSPREWFTLLGPDYMAGFKSLATQHGERFALPPETADLLAGRRRERRPKYWANHSHFYLRRLQQAVMAEACRCLAEGLAGRPGVEAAQQIDLAAVSGLGFPAYLGGPLWSAQQQGFAACRHAFDDLAALPGNRFELPSQILEVAFAA